MFSVRCILTAICFSAYSYAKLLDDPFSKPMLELGGESLQRGNAISTFGSSLIITTAEGSLLRINPVEGAPSDPFIFSFKPQPLANRVLSSTSGIGFLNGNQVVYTVVDSASDETLTGSRLLCVNLEDGSLAWSVPLAGTSVGTPQISGNLVYVVHNTNQGSVTVVSTGEEWSRVGTFDVVETTLGPGAIVRVDNRDVFAVASNADDGFSEEGALYLLLQEEGSEEQNLTDYVMIRVSDYPRSSVTQPFINEDLEVVVAQQGSSVSGWVGKNSLADAIQSNFKPDSNLQPRWRLPLAVSEDNEDAPILATPIASENGEILFTAAAGPQFNAIMLQQGRSLWRIVTSAPVVAPPVLGENVVYLVEKNGRVSQRTSDKGELLWTHECSGTCDGVIEADATVSENGNVLFYGDNQGRIFSLQVGNYPTSPPTGSPSITPTGVPTGPSAEPTSVPSLVPSRFPVLGQSESPTATQSSVPSQGPSRTSQPPSSVPSGVPVVAATALETEAPVADFPQQVPIETPVERQPVAPVAPVAVPSAPPTVESVQTAGSSRLPTGADVSELNQNPVQSLVSSLIENIVVVAAAAGGALLICLACSTWFLCCRRKPQKDTEDEEDNEEEWNEEQNAYKQSCEEAEKEALDEILKQKAAATLGTPTVGSFDYADGTPATLGSISENYRDSDDENSEDDLEIGFEMNLKNSGTHVEGVSKSAFSSMLPRNLSSRMASPERKENLNVGTPEFRRVASSRTRDSRAFASLQSSPSSDTEDATEEPGHIIFRDRASEDEHVVRTKSSEDMSDDGSLYMDDKSGMASNASRQNKSSKPREVPDDESSGFSAVSGGGFAGFFRSSSKAPKKQMLQPDPEPETATYHEPAVAQSVAQSLARKGVSVRRTAGQSRAGLFSRGGASRATGRIIHQPPESPQEVPLVVEQPPPVKPAPATHYHAPDVEHVSSTASTDDVATSSDDVWNSFLSELARAEENFFGGSGMVRSNSPPPPPPPRSDSPPPPPPPPRHMEEGASVANTSSSQSLDNTIGVPQPPPARFFR